LKIDGNGNGNGNGPARLSTRHPSGHTPPCPA
jgi:hypothetical protein